MQGECVNQLRMVSSLFQKQKSEEFIFLHKKEVVKETKQELDSFMNVSEEDYTLREYKAFLKCKQIENETERLNCQIQYCCPLQKRLFDGCFSVKGQVDECSIEASQLTKCYAEFARKAFILNDNI